LQRFVVGDQLGAPAFDLMQRQRFLRAAQRGRGHGFAQRFFVGAAHELAHVLHLAAPAFKALGAAELVDGARSPSGISMASSRSCGSAAKASPRVCSSSAWRLAADLLGRPSPSSSALSP
jgi:hypothetical protein